MGDPNTIVCRRFYHSLEKALLQPNTASAHSELRNSAGRLGTALVTVIRQY